MYHYDRCYRMGTRVFCYLVLEYEFMREHSRSPICLGAGIVIVRDVSSLHEGEEQWRSPWGQACLRR